MCGRFTQHYTWEEVHAFLSVFGPPRNLQPHYNIAPTDTVDVIRLDKQGQRELVPMRWGLIPGLVEENRQGGAGDVQRARGIRRRQADVPRSRSRSAAASSRRAASTNGPARKAPSSRISSPRPTARPLLAFAGAVGPLARSRDRRMDAVLHDHRVRRERLDGAVSRPHAGDARGEGFRRLA